MNPIVCFYYSRNQPFLKDTVQELLLLKKRNPLSEVWVGKKLGIEGSELVLDMQKSYDIDDFTWDDLEIDQMDSLFFHDPQKEFRKKSIISDSLLQDMTIDESESKSG